MESFINAVTALVGNKNILTKAVDIKPHSTGWRGETGKAIAVIFPQTLLQQWQVLQLCVKYDIIMLMQASNTGLTGGSTPDGDHYDRPVVIIKSEAINHIHLLEGGQQVVAFPGSTLFQLEDILEPINREPHSVIGSSCIGASVIGGVCNNSGGALLQRGPSYTELALYAHVTEDGELHLVNNTGLELGDTPEDILNNIEAGRYQKDNLPPTNKKASGTGYREEVRQIDAPTPARFNANPKYLYESSGSAGKISVFAVRLDTFPAPQKKGLFFISSKNPEHMNTIRRTILGSFTTLPILGEYMDKQGFDISCRYSRDVYTLLTLFGPSVMPKFMRLKKILDAHLTQWKIFGKAPMDRVAQFLFAPMGFLIPKRIRQAGNTYNHHLILETYDDGIAETQQLLDTMVAEHGNDFGYILGNTSEHKAAINIRFAAGNSLPRYHALLRGKQYTHLSFDTAYARNDRDVLTRLIPPSVTDAIVAQSNIGHFFCHVMHQSYVVDTTIHDKDTIEQEFLKFFAERNAIFPAEHNVGQKYKGADNLCQFYQSLDPTNTFNAGVGKMSKKKFYQ